MCSLTDITFPTTWMDLNKIAYGYPTLALLWLLEHLFSTLMISKFDPVECI